MTVRFALQTTIRASPEEVFAASLSIDDHLASMAGSGERAIGGVTSGLIGLGETVTWRARHFGIKWTMTSEITELEEHVRFVDEQLRGPFAMFRHEHLVATTEHGSDMFDQIAFKAPLGPLGWCAERVLLGWYVPHLIRQRNAYLKMSLER